MQQPQSLSWRDRDRHGAELSDGLNVGVGHFFVRQNHALEPGAGSIRRGGDAMVAG